MDEELSTRARALLQALRDRTDGRQRLDLAAVTRAFENAFAHLRGRPEARGELIELLGELRERALVRLPASEAGWDRNQRPHVPRWIQWPVRPNRPRAADQAAGIPWHPALAFIARLEGLRQRELRDAKAVQAWLARADGRPEELSVRERSLEIFGDDKHLELLLDTRLFGPGRLDLAVLRCHLVYVPLLAVETGAGEALLVVENKDTFDSALRAVRALGDRSPVRWVAFGNGEQILYSITSVQAWPTKPGHIWYFGDVDVRGMELLRGAIRRSGEIGVPASAHVGLYEVLLDAAAARGVELQAGNLCTPDRARELASMFEESIGARVADALARGVRYPQELVVGRDIEEILRASVVPRAP